MKKYAMLVLTLLLGGLAVARWDTNGWQARRQLADSLLQTLAPHIGEVLPSSQYPTNEVLAFAYPELLRYSPARDYVEREVNRRLYAEHGLKDEVDFSTSLFQMKPSFAERVEAYYRLALPNHPCAQDFVYPQTDSVALRSARLARLADSRWQLVYLRGFYCLVQHRFPLLATYPPAKRVRLMALAYNAGFHLPEAQLWRWEKVKLFPYGGLAEMIGRANTHSYADLAEEFFAQPNH